MRWQFLLVVVAVLTVGADDPQDEAGKLQGAWAVVSADGIDAPEEALKRLKVIIRRDTIHLMVAESEQEPATLREKEKATFKLDPSRKPKAIDLTKDPKGQVALGIYELDGDILKLVWRQGGPRPTEILTKRRPKKFTGAPSEDDDLMIMVLRKEKAP
jgi:uncharacterized protein (TIGR03067 family)